MAGAGENRGVRDVVVPADAHNAAEGFVLKASSRFFWALVTVHEAEL